MRQYVGVDESRPELRIGDRERRATDAHLQQAHGDGVLTLTEYDERAAQCWAARTQADLDELVRDLPPYRPEAGAEAPTVAAPVPAGEVGTKEPAERRNLGERIGRGVVGVVLAGVALFFGGQVVTADDATAVMGSRAVAVGDQERVEVGAIFGSVRVTVPDGVRARVTGTGLFGSTECQLACTGTGREVEVNATSLFGSVDVVRPGELTADEIEDAREEAEDAAEDAAEEADDD